MEMILCIVYANKIEDFDLSRQRQSITVGAFRASPSGGWNYRCGEDSGMLRPGDVILIDEDKSIAALVLEKHQGRAAWLDWRDGLTIGRKIGNQIALKDGLVSSRHCQIVRRKGNLYVEALNSTNGTFLNDKRVTRAPFRPGDVLKLGRYRLRAGEKRLCLENLDGGVTLGVPEVQLGPEDVFGKKDYPWFSPAPRILMPQEDLHITIESAPSIGDKPSMSLGGLALSPAMMAMSLSMQALRYGMGKRKYNKQEQRRAEVYANYLAGVEEKLRQHAAGQHEQAGADPAERECLCA